MLFGTLNPAVKMAISHGAMALQGNVHLLWTPHTFTFQGQVSRIQWVVIVLVLTFGEGADLSNLQRSGNRYYLPLTFEPLCFVHLGTKVSAHEHSSSSGIGGPL